MAYKIITLPASEPISLDDARTHLRVDGDNGQATHYDDALIAAQLSAARSWVQDYLGYIVAPTTIEMALDAFPDCPLALEGGAVQSIVSVSYIDIAGDEQSMSLSDFYLDDYSSQNWLVPKAGTSWPSALQVANSVKIRYVVGASYLDPMIRAAILLMLCHLYENRENNSTMQTHKLPFDVENCLCMKRSSWGI